MIIKKKEVRQAFRQTINDWNKEHPNYEKEFGHLEGDTIVGNHQKSAFITLVERLGKCIITIKPEGWKAKAIDKSFDDWFNNIPRHTFISIIFDCEKETLGWKSISNKQDIDIYFADLGTPSQWDLNENSNGPLRKSRLPKEMDFNSVTQEYISSVSNRRNSIPRKS